MSQIQKYGFFGLLAALLLVAILLFGKTSYNRQVVVEAQHVDTVPPIPIPQGIRIKKHAEAKTEKVKHKLDSLLKRVHKRYDFHGAVLVAQKGKIVYSGHIGYADFRKKKLLDESSVFQLASVSKQFTAAAVLVLMEKGRLQLTDSVTKYYPEFPYKDVTIQHLLYHTAGLPNYFWVAEHKWEGKDAPSNQEMMDLLCSSDVGRFFIAGRRFDYSNTAYFVLASIVEKVSGLSFSEFTEKEVFKPLGMKNTYVYSYKKDTIREQQLIGYRLYRGWRHIKIPGTVNDAVVGDKNVYATTEDLYKWVEGLNSGKLLSEETVQMMYSKGKNKYGYEIPYGLGFRLSRWGEEKIYHYGKWNGFSTGIVQYPADDLVLIVLEHTSFNGMTSLNANLKKLVLKHFDA